MPTVTALLPQPRRKDRVNLFLDSAFAFPLHKKLAQEAGLFIGQELAEADIRALEHQATLRFALDIAYRFLALRPRTEAEIRTRLRRGRVAAELTERVVARLKEQRLLDDVAFAHQWAEHRAASSPRSRSLVRHELQLKGIGQELAQEAVLELDDEEAAYQAGARRVTRLKVQDHQEFRKRLWDFLRRRGFGYNVITITIERLWRERVETADSE